MNTLVLLRHGESEWNRENRFTGWTDVGLTEKGVNEAIRAGNLLKDAGHRFDAAYTSVLQRAIKTLWLTLEAMSQMWIPETKSWRLNERHYGALQGLNKAETAAKYGEDQVHIWRRSYDILPPPLTRDDPRFPGLDPMYHNVPAAELPLAESLATTITRFIPYWQDTIAPMVRSGQKVIIAAHGNSLRALIKHLDRIPDEQIVDLNIPTGIPLIYELDEELKPIRHYYLGDPAAVQTALQAVANQGKAASKPG